MATLDPVNRKTVRRRDQTTASWSVSGGVSSASSALSDWRDDEVPRVPSFDVVDDAPLLRRFAQLAEVWRRETMLESFVHRKAMHPAYQQIIGLGPSVIPVILRELAERSDHWFWALTALTGQDPAGDCGTIPEGRQAWLRWGRERGLI
jgi:hypothetical protein